MVETTHKTFHNYLPTIHIWENSLTAFMHSLIFILTCFIKLVDWSEYKLYVQVFNVNVQSNNKT